MEQSIYKVYARLDGAGNIIAVNSSAFLPDTTGWTLIDEGTDDRYHHAQGHYLHDGIYTPDGIPIYRWDGAQVIQRTAEEIEADRAAIPPNEPTPSPIPLLQAQVAALSARNDFFEELIAEMAMMVY